jgi:anaphase-promoting complex subunit 8
MYTIFRFGIVLKELGLKQEALEILLQSVEKEPLLWATWIEIAALCNTKEEVC